jgi:polar amino acid transport system substrate-binding protein
MFKAIYRSVLLAAALLAAAATAKAEDTIAKLKDSGKLVVGIKVDYRPFGFRNEKGEMLGLEHDLVADIVARLKTKLGRAVEIEKVPVTAQNRMEFLQQGKIDLLIATMNDTPERRKILDIIQPDYYASGVTLLTLKKNHVTKWDDIKGKTVCTLQGAWYNKEFTEKYGFTAQPYAGTAEAVQAALDNRCVAFLDDDSQAAGVMQDPERQKDLEIPVDALAEAPWGMAVRLGDSQFAAFLSETVTDWHRKGTIAELEKKWGIKPTKWIQDMHKKYASM